MRTLAGCTRRRVSKNHNYKNPELCIKWQKKYNDSDQQALTFKYSNLLKAKKTIYYKASHIFFLMYNKNFTINKRDPQYTRNIIREKTTSRTGTAMNASKQSRRAMVG